MCLQIFLNKYYFSLYTQECMNNLRVNFNTVDLTFPYSPGKVRKFVNLSDQKQEHTSEGTNPHLWLLLKYKILV